MIAVLTYRAVGKEIEAALQWTDPAAGLILHSLPVPYSPNLGVFPQHDCALVSYREDDSDWLDVYALSDWQHTARLSMDCRAHFNVRPNWSTFLEGPDGDVIYMYKARTLGHHHAEDFLCGLNPRNWEFEPWDFRISECVAGLSKVTGTAHAQFLFVADGVSVGRLPMRDLDQRLAYWLGPDGGMGPTVSLGSRPRAHNKPGHARAIHFSPKRMLSIAVCDDGVTHLIDSAEFRYLERQEITFPPEHSMPLFAAEVEPAGRFLYVGVAPAKLACQGLFERVVVHDLERARVEVEWSLPVSFSHLALSEDGRFLYGAAADSDHLWMLDTRNGGTAAILELPGRPQYVICTSAKT